MGLTKDYLRYTPDGTCNLIASANGAIATVSESVCCVAACEYVYMYNLKTSEKVAEIEGSDSVTALKFSNDRSFLAIGYGNGMLRLYSRAKKDFSSFSMFSGHKTGVNCIAFSPDGLLIASGGKDSAIVMWDTVSESGVCRLNGHKGSITHLQFTMDGRFLISSSKDTFVKYWSMDTQSCFYTLADCRSEVYSFALLNHDRLLILATAELELRVFTLTWLNGLNRGETEEGRDVDDDAMPDQENKVVRCKKVGHILRHAKGRALQLAVSSDSRILTCTGSLNLVDVYRIYDDNERIKRITKKMHKAKRKANESREADNIQQADIAKDVTTMISWIGLYDSQVKVKWIDFIPVVRTSESHIQEYRFFALNFNNSLCCISVTVNLKSNDLNFTTAWGLEKLGHRTDVRCIAMAENDANFVSGSAESALVWNRYSLKVVNVLREDTMKDITAIMFVTGDMHVITANKSGNIFLFDLSTNDLVDSQMKVHEGAIWQLSPTPDKKGFISCGADKKLIYWSYGIVKEVVKNVLSFTKRCVLELPDEALCLSASDDSRFISVGLLDNTARVYFVDTLKFFHSLYGHSLPITTMHISNDSKLVITGSADKSVKIWGLDFGDCHKSLHAHSDVVTCVRFVPKQHLFWSAGKDGLLKQWDGDKFVQIQVLNRHSAEIHDIAQTSSGKYLVSASHDKSIRLWILSDELINLEEEQEMEREREYEKHLAIADDVVPGEEQGVEAELAAQKTINSISSAENIINAIEIMRMEKLVEQEGDAKHQQNPLVLCMKSSSLDHFILDIIQKVPSSHLEKSLLMVPYSFVPDILNALSVCISKCYKVELACRVLMFLIKVHLNYITNNTEQIALMDKLRSAVPVALQASKDLCGFNYAALQMFRIQYESRGKLKLFSDVSEVSRVGRRRKNKKALLKVLV